MKQPINRRRFLKETAGALTILVAGGAVWRASDQGVFSTGQGPAYEPWRTWQSDASNGVLSLVRAAILASSPHNSQPWRFIVSASQIDLYADQSRNIGAIDPLLREMHVGLGCALENLLLAASASGYKYKLSLLPNPNDLTHMARVRLTVGEAQPNALYDAIAQRHTNRGRYDTTREVSSETLQSISSLRVGLPNVTVHWFSSAAQRERLGSLIVEATAAIIADAEQSADSAKWLRHDWQDLQGARDGVTLDAQGLSPLVLTAAKMLPALSQQQNDNAWLQITKDIQVGTAAAFGIIAVPNPRAPLERLRGGQFWQRMQLWATTQGLAMQPLNQVAERVDREASQNLEPRFTRALVELMEGTSTAALMPFRIGYPLTPALPSPRRSVEAVVI